MLLCVFSFFVKHDTIKDGYTYTHTYPYECTHAHPTPTITFERLRPRNLIRRVLRLPKSPQAPRGRRKHLLPLKNIPHLLYTKVFNLEFELC
jgi:hypothetical protein